MWLEILTTFSLSPSQTVDGQWTERGCLSCNSQVAQSAVRLVWHKINDVWRLSVPGQKCEQFTPFNVYRMCWNHIFLAWILLNIYCTYSLSKSGAYYVDIITEFLRLLALRTHGFSELHGHFPSESLSVGSVNKSHRVHVRLVLYSTLLFHMNKSDNCL